MSPLENRLPADELPHIVEAKSHQLLPPATEREAMMGLIHAMRRLFVTGLSAVTIACGGEDATKPEPPEGDYGLVAVGAAPLPAPVGNPVVVFTITAGDLHLGADGTYRVTVTHMGSSGPYEPWDSGIWTTGPPTGIYLTRSGAVGLTFTGDRCDPTEGTYLADLRQVVLRRLCGSFGDDLVFQR